MPDQNRIQFIIEIDEHGQPVIKSIGDDFEKLDKTTQKTRRSFNAARAAWISMASAFATFGVAKIAGDFLNVASSFEQMEVKLDALTRGQGLKTLEEINAWALEMPVNTRKAVDTFAMMQAMGLDPTIEKMQTLVDVSSIFGEEAMPRVARALGQMITLGKLSAEELNQMSEAGINARKYLTESFNMTVEELQKSEIGINQIVSAIWKGLDADYSGAAQRAQNSWQGIWTTFISYVEEAERQIMAAGVFDELKKQMSGINKELSLWITNNGALIRQKVPEYIDKIRITLESIKSIYDSLPEGVIGAAGLGLIGTMLFGPQAGAVIALIALTSSKINQFKRDHPEIFGSGGPKHFPIGPGVPGYDIYHPQNIPPPPVPAAAGAGIMPPSAETMFDFEMMSTELAEYQALMKEVAKAEQEFSDAKLLSAGTYAIMEEQLRRDIGARIELTEVKLEGWAAEQEAMTALVESHDMVRDSLNQLMTADQAYIQLRGAVKNALVASILGYESFGAALKKAVAQMLAQIAAEAAIRAVLHTAMGVAALTPWGAAVYGPASAQFQAAAIFAAVAIASGAAAAALASSAGGVSAGESAGYQESRGSGAQAGAAESLSREADRKEEYVQKWEVHIHNMVGEQEWVENNIVPTLRKVAKRDTEITVSFD